MPEGTTISYSTDGGANWSTDFPTIKDVGTMTVTVKAPSNKSVTATLYAPDGTVLGQSSGSGTRTFNASGPSSGTYRLVVTGTSGSYTATVQHLP